MCLYEIGGGSLGKRKRTEYLNFMAENHSLEHVYGALAFSNAIRSCAHVRSVWSEITQEHVEINVYYL